MLTLLSECHFWSIRDEIRIKPTDFGAFRYSRMRDLQQATADDVSTLAKRDYTERRNGTAVLKNSNRKATGRLKDNIKKMEELLRTQRIVFTQWQDATVMLLLFSSGLIAHICVDIYTGDILRMVFEKYFVGKLAAEVITDGKRVKEEMKTVKICKSVTLALQLHMQLILINFLLIFFVAFCILLAFCQRLLLL